MAWWQNGDSSNGPRKKWNVTDNSSSLKNLKTQLAEDGSSDLQYDLARDLLKDDIGEDVSVESHHQGINWLLRAANQGHEQAILLLSECYARGRGINPSNEREVRLCLEMSPAERAARKAARELFLCLANGGEFITASQLENKMREIYQMDDNHKNRRLGGGAGGGSSSPDEYLNVRNNSEILTEANLISAAVNYSHGTLPSLNNTVCVSAPHPDSLNHIPSFYRPLFHPILFLTLLYHRIVAQLSALPDLLWQYKLPLLLVAYLVFSRDTAVLLQLLPTAVYLLTILLMVVTTFQMLRGVHAFNDFRIWSGLFQHYGREVAMYRENTEAQFLRNNLKPYLYFFVGLLANVMLRPLVKHELLPAPEITIVAVSLALATALVFMWSHQKSATGCQKLFPNVFILLSLLIHVLAKYPYDMEHVMESSWALFDALMPGGHKLTPAIELRLNFRSLFYLLIPLVLVQIGSCDKWRGVYRYLVPHFVTLSWMQLGMSYAQDSTAVGLVRAAVELAATLLFLPLVGLATMLLPVLTAVEAFLLDQKVKVVAFIILATVLVILYGYLSSSRKWNKWLLPIQFTLYAVALFTYVVPLMERNLKLLEESEALYEAGAPQGMSSPTLDGGASTVLKPDTLQFDAYYKFCQTSTHQNKISAQLRCSLLDDELVRWEGVVKSVEILQVVNYKRHLLSFVKPKVLRDLLTCLWGDKNAVECPPGDKSCEATGERFAAGLWKCNVNRDNVYSYLLRTKIKSTTALLTADHSFGNFTTHLQANDRIWFEGRLRSKIHQRDVDFSAPDEPIVELRNVGCISCHAGNLKYEEQLANGDNSSIRILLATVQTSFKYLLNALFNPVLVFN